MEPGIFPSELSNRITTIGTSGDPLGYGSYAASVVFQLSAEAHITSLQIYQNGVVRSDFIKSAFEWAAQNVSGFDVVLLAIPPSDFLDPITSAMAGGSWQGMVDMILAAPNQGSTGKLFGIAMSDDLFSQQVGSYDVWRWLAPFRNALWRWNRLIELIEYMNGQGVAVVAPAGDLGANPQTVFGLANLREVVTVGGFNPPDASSGIPGESSRLEQDPHVVKWMKRHGITIAWIDGQKHQRRYCPDFLVEYEGGRKAVIEVKDPSRLDSDDVVRKRKAAELWCKQRRMEYILATAG